MNILDSNQRGSTLIAALLISVVILVAGLGMLSQRVFQGKSLNERETAAQALALAQSGLDDCVLKLRRDYNFAPRMIDGDLMAEEDRQTTFSYTEIITDRTGEDFGGYRVSVDAAERIEPSESLRIVAIGFVGDVDEPVAVREIRAEFNLNPRRRNGLPQEATFYKVLNYQDTGNY